MCSLERANTLNLASRALSRPLALAVDYITLETIVSFYSERGCPPLPLPLPICKLQKRLGAAGAKKRYKNTFLNIQIVAFWKPLFFHEISRCYINEQAFEAT